MRNKPSQTNKERVKNESSKPNYFHDCFCSIFTILTLIFIYLSVPYLATCIFLIFFDEPELGAEIDPGMALTPLPSSIWMGIEPTTF